MGKHFTELGVCVPRYDELTEDGMVCAFAWKTDAYFLGKPIKMHNICGRAEGHNDDHITGFGATYPRNAPVSTQT